MVGKIGEETASLVHVGSFFRINVANIPAGGDDMKFIFTADKKITGEFVIDLGGNTLSGVATSAAASSLFTVRSGGTYLEDPTDYLVTGYAAVQTDGRWVVSPAG